MEQDRDIRIIVWAENRDELFLQWLAEDCSKLLDAGFSINEVKHMVMSLRYVHYWRSNPAWMFPINGLPKGYRWRDGQKFSYKNKRRKRAAGETYVFLPVGENLYIKGIEAVGTHFSDYSGVDVENFRSLTCREIVSSFPSTPFLQSSFTTFWHSQGLALGYTIEWLRPINGSNQTMEKERK